MAEDSVDSSAARAPVALLALAGLAFLAGALLYNELVLTRAAGKELHEATIALIRRSQLAFAAIGAALVAAAAIARRGAWIARPAVGNAILAALVFVTPLVAAELALKPLARSDMHERTTLFERDAELGWKLRPGVATRWVGVDVVINDKGMRGPEVPYERTPGARRIVWLGDSVTFGYGLPRAEDAYPFRVAAALAKDGAPVETVDAAVDGYSPWQEQIWLEREGFRYAPDLVVVGFVLNDVTEKLSLARFGGTGQGVQLDSTATWVDRLLGPSALVHYVRKIGARLRFGADTQAGAVRQERLDVETLARDPESEAVRKAWEITTEELRSLVAAARAKDVPIAIVAFPYVFQFADADALAAPQRVLANFAEEEKVPFLDLLQPLAARAVATGTDPQTYFLDPGHPSIAGSEEIAALVAEFLTRERLLAPDGSGLAREERE